MSGCGTTGDRGRAGFGPTATSAAWLYTCDLPTLSYTRGADEPLLEQNLFQALPRRPRSSRTARPWSSATRRSASPGASCTTQAERTARGLAGLGLRPGDRAGIWASNCVEWILLQHAAARAGVVLVNVNPAYRSHELRYVLAKSRIRALFLRERDCARRLPRDSGRIAGRRAPAARARGLARTRFLGRDAGGAARTCRPAPPPRTTSPTSSTPRAPRARPRACCSRTATCSTTAWRSACACEATEQDRICAPGAAVSLLRLGDRRRWSAW